MNDPGVDGTLQEAADDLERDPYEADEKQEEEEEEAFLDPTHVSLVDRAAGANFAQSLVVRVHSMSSDRWHLWAHGQRLQYLRPRAELEGIHSSWSR